MCEHHKYEHMDNRNSLKVLRQAKNEHCGSCCPELPQVVEKVEAWNALVGVQPVYNNSRGAFVTAMTDLVNAYENMRQFGYWTKHSINQLIASISEDEFKDNLIPQYRLDQLAENVSQDGEPEVSLLGIDPPWKPFKLMKRSPKISVFLASVLKHLDMDYERHDLVKQFNTRGVMAMEGFEMVLSTEPHRIAGMSAFGKYTSCQDWIRKDPGHEYHNYTHQSWANLKDPTVGILFIREKQELYEAARDMLARSLVRVVPLEHNGQVVVYIHRIYSKSPYEEYLTESVNKWIETLPENYHVIKLYDSFPSSGKNKYGVNYSGYEWETVELSDNLSVYGENREQCEYCDGAGTRHNECQECYGSGRVDVEIEVECSCCDGRGYVEGEDEEEVECDECYGRGMITDEVREDCDYCSGEGSIEGECGNCDGDGYFTNDEEECYPYNDHSNEIDFNETHIEFKVPNYLYNWEVNPNESEEDVNNEKSA